MTLNLSKDLEQFVHDAVRAGHYASEVDVVNDALTRLRRAMPVRNGKLGRGNKRSKSSTVKPAVRTEAELQRHMLEIGLMSQLPDREADFEDPDDQPITIKGEPLSETIIRERR